MPKFYCEGQSEEVYLKSAIKYNLLNEEYTQKFVSVEFEVIHANKIDVYIKMVPGPLFYFAVDTDDEITNYKTIDAVEIARRNNKMLEVFKQTPNFDYFIAAHFDDFNPSMKDKKQLGRYLLSKMPKGHWRIKNKNVKKISYEEILEWGGNIKNTYKYSKRFEILKIFNK